MKVAVRSEERKNIWKTFGDTIVHVVNRKGSARSWEGLTWIPSCLSLSALPPRV
jgi:hypothetical protein